MRTGGHPDVVDIPVTLLPIALVVRDVTRSVAADPTGRAAGPAGRPRGCGPRPDVPRARRSGSCSGRGSVSSPPISRMPVAIPFAELPGWPAATAPGHAGRLLLGRLGGRTVVMLQGRFHLYEGNDPGLVIQPVLLFKQLGARLVVLTNAAGGLDPSFGPGTLMVMRDHINLTGRSPLIGPNADELGPRFPDLTDAWSPRLRDGAPGGGRGRERRARGGHLRRADRPDLRDPGRGPDAGRARWPRGRDVDGARVHRGAVGRPRGLRHLARHQRRGRLLRRAARRTRRSWPRARWRVRVWRRSSGGSWRTCRRAERADRRPGPAVR